MRAKREAPRAGATNSKTLGKSMPKAAAAAKNALDGGARTNPRLNRRDLDERACRAIASHCKFLPKTILEHKEVDGMLLRDRVREDLKSLEKGQRLGAKYWCDVLAKYAAHNATAADLAPEQEDEPVSDKLLDALAKMHDDNPALRSNRALITFLGTAGPLNQTEWIGMVKVMSDPKIERLRNYDELMIEWMKFTDRTGAQGAFPKEVGACKALFDKALTTHWASLKKSAVKLSTFLDIHVNICSLLMDRTDLLAVIASKNDMKAVRNQVCRLNDSCICGKSMFGEHLAHFGASDFSERVVRIVEKAFGGEGQITEGALEDCRIQCAEVVQSTAHTKSLQGKRLVEIPFLASKVSVTVASADEEVSMRIGAAMKNLCIGRKGGLPMLSYEEWIQPDIGDDERALPQSALEGPIAARRLVAEIIADDQIASFAEVARIILAQTSSLLVLDRTFRLEICFLEQAEELIGQVIEKDILCALPDPDAPSVGPQTLEQSMVQLSMVRGQVMVKRSNSSAVGKLESVQLVLAQMQRGVSPEAAPDLSQFFNTVLERCALFFTVGENKTLVRGKPALQRYWRTLQDAAAAGTVVKVPEIEALRPFWWLLSKAQVGQIQVMLQTAIKAATDEGRSSGASSSSAAASTLKVGDSKRKGPQAGLEQLKKKATLMKLFGK